MWYDGVCTVCCSSRHSPPLQNLYIRSAWAFDIKHIQGWKFALSLFRSKLLILKSDRDAIHFRSSLQKSNREQIVLIALYKRARWANRSCRSLKKNDVSALLIIGSNHLQKTSDSLEKLVCIWQFFPFLCPRANRSLCSSLILSFLKSQMSDSLFCSQKNWRFAGKTKELIPNTEYIHIYTHTPTHTPPHTPTHTHTQYTS